MKIKTTLKKSDVVNNGYKGIRTRFGTTLYRISPVLFTISLQSHKGKVSEPERPAELRRKTDVADAVLATSFKVAMRRQVCHAHLRK